MRFWFLTLLSLNAFAGDPTAVSLNNIPLFASAVDVKYKAATEKVQEAFLIQSGIGSKFDMVQSAAMKAATDSTTKAINQNTPFKAKDVFFVAGTSYALFVKKQVAKSFQNPLFPSVTHTFTVGRDISSTLIQITF